MVESGDLKPGTKLPSVRTLSAELNVSKNTITKAYEELQNDGFIVSREKSGFFISDPKGEPIDPMKDSEPCIPTVDSILNLHKDDETTESIVEIPGSEELLSELANNQDDIASILPQPQIQQSNEIDFDFETKSDTSYESVTQSVSLDFIIPSEEAIHEENNSFVYASNFDPDKQKDSDNDESAPEEFDNLPELSPSETGTDESVTSSVPEKSESVTKEDDNTELSLAQQYQLPPLEFDVDTVDPESLEESIRSSFNEILSLPGSFMYKKSPSFGESCLKYAICHLLSTFRDVEVAPEQIIIASTSQQLLRNVLNLQSLNPSSQLYAKSNQGKGLLRIAESLSAKGTESSTSKNNITKNLSVGIISDSYCEAEKTFSDLNLPVEHLEQDIYGLSPKSLRASNTTIVYSSKKEVSIGFQEDLIKRREEILSWASEKPYRYIIENDVYAAEHAGLTFLHSDKAERVIYINSFTNLICKGISGAWLVLPKHLIPEYHSKYFFRDCTLSVLDQLFLTDFVNSGKLDTYLTNLEML